MDLTNQRRYAPLDRSKIPGFPNPLPKFDWSKNLPLFKDETRDDAALHLLKFHMHIRKFKVKFHEDCLMKIFTVTLEEKARSWYENLPASSICSLKHFHAAFHDKYKGSYSSLLLIQDCCDNFESFIQYLENYYDDDDQFMDHEILEVLKEKPFQKVEALLELSSPQKEEDDVCCSETHEVSPLETILVSQQTNQNKEEIQFPELSQIENSNENQQQSGDLEVETIELKNIEPQDHLQLVVSSEAKDQSNSFDENHVTNFLSLHVNEIRQHTLIDHDLSSKINESLQFPCKPLYDKDNDEDFPVVCDKVVIFDEDQEYLEHLAKVDNKEEKQLSNHLNQATVWNEVCFPGTNHPEDLIWQDYHYPLVNILQPSIQEEIKNHEQISANSNYHRSEDRFIKQCVEEKSADLMCVFDDITSFDDLPKYDQYDDNYVLQIQTNFTEQSETSFGKKEIRFHQLENNDQLVHFSYESEEENVENLEISEASLPLYFESFQFLKGMWYKISKEKGKQLVETYEVPFKPICNKLHQSFQVFHDPITDEFDNECNHNFSPSTDYESQNQDDNGFTSQTFQSIEISSQSAVENMQGDKDKSDISISWHAGHTQQMYNCLNQFKNSVYMLQDPFVQFLDPTKEIRNFLIFSKVNKAIFDCKISILNTNKHKQQRSPMYMMLEWLHWLFHFT